jgi:hypothetical protein
MTMTWVIEWSDVLGVIAGLALAFPHFKDQYYRFRRDSENRRQNKSPWPGLRKALATAWEEKRADYDGLDSIVLATGALVLVASFVLQALGS